MTTIPDWRLYGILPDTLPLPPYLRMTQRSKFGDKAQAYLERRGDIGDLIRKQLAHHPLWRGRHRQDKEPIIDAPYRLALIITMPPIKSGPNKGKLPAGGRHGAGDLDNYYKALNDALVKKKIVHDDAPRWHRGHGTIRSREGIYLGERLSFTWALMAHTRTEAIE